MSAQVITEESVPANEPKRRTAEVKENARVALTTEQLLDAGRELAASQAEVRQLEDDFRSVRDEWKSRISAVEARITTTAGRISRGYDIKPVACVVTFDEPEPGLKTCVRQDTGERLWVKEMTEFDKQLVLDFEAEQAAAESAEDAGTEAPEEESPENPDAARPDFAALAAKHEVDEQLLVLAYAAVHQGADTTAKLQRVLKIGFTSAEKLLGIVTEIELFGEQEGEY